MCPGNHERRLLRWPAMLSLVAALHVYSGESVQGTPARFESRDVAVSVDSGSVGNVAEPAGPLDDRGPVVVFSEVIEVPGVPWLRLHFERCELSGSRMAGKSSFLRIASLADEAVQRLDAATVREWGMSSAYFNGEAVRLELLAYPNTGPHRVVVNKIRVGVATASPESLCDNDDDRVPVDDARVGRIWPIGCTAWLIGHQCFLTAGHCVDDDPDECGPQLPDGVPDTAFTTSVVEFNVPASRSNGTAVRAHPDDQYPIDPDSIQFAYAGCSSIGNDWAYFGCRANANTGMTPFEAQQAAFVLAEAAPAPDETAIQITGYGDDANDPQRAYTCQTDIGTYDVLAGTVIRYNDLDTEGGDSGAPIHHLGLEQAIGIHTNGGCDSPGGANMGTAIQNAGLQAALASPQGVCAGPEFTEAISRAFTIVRSASVPVFSEAVSRSFTIGPPPSRFAPTEAISKSFTIGPPPFVPEFTESISRAVTIVLPIIPGDFNGDRDVDQDDFATFEACLSGSWVLFAPGCGPTDFDDDGDTDQSDYGVFQHCLSGEGVPADPRCAE